VPSNSLIKQFEHVLSEFCREYASIQRIYLGYSGGADSTALLFLLHNYLPSSAELTAIHVNHGISQNADNWQKHCQKQCDELNVPLIIRSLNLDKSMANLEQVARQSRLDIYSQLNDEKSVFVLGHHANDQAETLLMRLIRGAGLTGLSSIKAMSRIQDLRLWRPLIGVTKQSLIEFLIERKISWVEDESNRDVSYLRNFVRQKVIPLLAKKQNNLIEVLSQTTQNLAEAESVLQQYLIADLPRFLDGKAVDISLLRKESPAKQALLIRSWLSFLQIINLPERQQIAQVINHVGQQTSYAEIACKGFCIILEKGRLFVLPAIDLKPYHLPIFLGENELPSKLGTLTAYKSSDCMRVKCHLLSQLYVQQRPKPVSLKPLGRHHSRSLKKLYQELEVPRHLRDVYPVIMLDEEVVCIPGVLVNQKYAEIEGEGIAFDWLCSFL